MEESVRSQLTQFVAAAEQLWSQYLQVGPGQLTPDAWHPIKDATDELNHLLSPDSNPNANLLASVEELQKLLHRCVHQSEGLSFVTGEAGLIPRRDLHERCELLLVQLSQY